MGEQSYKIALPPHLHVHKFCHVSLLKKYIPDLEHILDLNDNILVNQEEFQMTPERILEVKEKALRNRNLREVLVQWKGYSVEDASWEDWDHLSVLDFPFFKLETLAIFLIYLSFEVINPYN